MGRVPAGNVSVNGEPDPDRLLCIPTFGNRKGGTLRAGKGVPALVSRHSVLSETVGQQTAALGTAAFLFTHISFEQHVLYANL